MKALKRKEGNGREASLAQPMETAMTHFREEMDKAMERFWRGGMEGPWAMMREWTPMRELMPWATAMTAWAPFPAIDVSEDEKGIAIRADVPGLEAKDVAVEVSDNLLTIRGSREEEKTEKTAMMSRHERRFGRFERTIMLPSYIDPTKVEAKYDKGTLTVTAPRAAGKEPKRVAVQTAS